MAEAIAKVMLNRFRVWAVGPKPTASTRPPGGGCFTPAGRVPAFVTFAELALPNRTDMGGETLCVS